MAWLRKLKAMFQRRRLEGELDEELAFHIEMRKRKFVEQGMSPEEATRAARLHFGNVTLTGEDSRQFWGFRWLDELGQDMRFAFRSFKKNPGATATAVITLALGIGIGTAVFSVVNALLFKPLPYENPDRLVMAWSVNSEEGVDLELARIQGRSMSTPELEDWKKSGIFDSLIAFAGWTMTIIEPGEPLGILAYPVSPGFFEMTGIQPILGRGFLPEEEPMGGRNNVLVITHEFWRRRFHEDPGVIGQEVVMSSRTGPKPFEIVGVLPRGFSFFNRQTDMITPLPWEATDRSRRSFKILARLKDGLSLQQAQARADVFSDGLARQFPESNEGWKVKLVPLAEDSAGHLAPAMLALLAAVGCVLFIACSNVANLFLVQFTSRSRELAMRYALGASRMRVLRQLLTESMLLSISGGLLGFALATQVVHYFRSVIPGGNTFSKYLVQTDGIEVDLTLVLFAGLITLLTGILVVLIPVFRSSELQLESSLRDAGRTAFGNRWGNRAHDALLMTEVAIAVVLVVASGLLVRSISEMYRQGPGFDPENVFHLRVSRNNWGIRQQLREETESRQEFYQALNAWTSVRNKEIQARVASLPGITSIASGGVPMRNYYRLYPATAIDGQSGAQPAEVQRLTSWVGEGYFETLRIPLLRGRTFESRDLETENVYNVVVSEKLASRLWADRDPIGKRLKTGNDELTVIGVVGNVRQEGMHRPSQPTLYWPAGGSSFLIRTNRKLEGLLPEVRQAIRQADATAFIGRTVPLKDAVLETIWRVHYSLILLGGLSTLALILALVGLYSTLSYIVRARTGEIGLRMALGADQRDVLSLVLRHGLAVVGVGLLIGLIGAAALTRFLSNLLFGVTPTDPLTFISVACAIMATATMAAYLPARRASKVDPMVALRHE